jgi:hypothetical protein
MPDRMRRTRGLVAGTQVEAQISGKHGEATGVDGGYEAGGKGEAQRGQ